MINRYNSIYSRIMQSGFIRHIFVLSGASALAQFVNIASMPLLSRLYSPNDFGVLSIFSSVLGLLATVSGFRYYLVLPLARRERYVHSIIWLSVLLQMAFVLILVFAFYILGVNLNGTRYEALLPYKYLIIIGVFAMGMYEMAVQWAVREKSFSLIATTKLTQAFASSAIKIIGAFSFVHPLGLLLGYVIGQSSGCFTLIRHIVKLHGKPQYSFPNIKRAAISYRNMCLIDTPGALLNMAGAYMLPLLIAYYYNDDVVGAFSMAYNLLILPSAIVGQAIGQVFAQKASEAHYNGTLDIVTVKTFDLLSRVGLFPVLICSLFAPWIFALALGSQWMEAGNFASILGPWIAINFIYSPMSVLFTTLMQQRLALIFTSVYTMTRLGSVIVFGQGNPLDAMIALSISGSVMMIIGTYVLMSKTYVKGIGKRIFNVFVETLVSLSPCIALLFLKEKSIVLTVSSLLASVSLYIFFTLKTYKNCSKR